MWHTPLEVSGRPIRGVSPGSFRGPTPKVLETYTTVARDLHQSSPAFTNLLSNPKFTKQMDMPCRPLQSTPARSVSRFCRRKQVTVPCRYLCEGVIRFVNFGLGLPGPSACATLSLSKPVISSRLMNAERLEGN